jgi:hypothetical protein
MSTGVQGHQAYRASLLRQFWIQAEATATVTQLPDCLQGIGCVDLGALGTLHFGYNSALSKF